ncbi:hypothetical protein LCGC14_2545680 [marine sediment metagenome]|uniref:Uncharacterized protein n=1 Tax=marine sediment metagenome TaxID=412755 RepID=A0A0F9BC61_9ZZZZ
MKIKLDNKRVTLCREDMHKDVEDIITAPGTYIKFDNCESIGIEHAWIRGDDYRRCMNCTQLQYLQWTKAEE